MTRAWVSPRVKRAEPWVRGRTLWRISIGRTVRVSRPSMRGSPFRAGGFGVGRELGFDGGVDFAELFHAGLLGADRVGGLEAFVGEFDDAGDEGFVLRSRGPVPSRLAGFGDKFVDGLDDDLQGLVTRHDGVEHRGFRTMSTARSVPATTRSRRECLSCSVVGLITKASSM